MAEKKANSKEAKKAQGKPQGAQDSKKSKADDADVALMSVKIPCRLEKIYRDEIVPKLKEKFQYKSVMQVPRLDKIVVNMGVGDAVSDAKLLQEAIADLEAITGRKPSVRRSKKAISNFKLRENIEIGAKVTLRKDAMYEFLDRFINIALPRVRDFRGLPDKSFDGRGNYTIGIKEQIIFPEINVEKVLKVLGMDVTFVSTAKTDAEAYELLASFGFPFRKKEMK